MMHNSLESCTDTQTQVAPANVVFTCVIPGKGIREWRHFIEYVHAGKGDIRVSQPAGVRGKGLADFIASTGIDNPGIAQLIVVDNFVLIVEVPAGITSGKVCGERTMCPGKSHRAFPARCPTHTK